MEQEQREMTESEKYIHRNVCKFIASLYMYMNIDEIERR